MLTAGMQWWIRIRDELFTSLVPRSHTRREEKGSGYNSTSLPTLEGRNQHTIVSDHMLTYAIIWYIINAM